MITFKIQKDILEHQLPFLDDVIEEVELEIEYEMFGEYFPGNRNEPPDFPELDVKEVKVTKINETKIEGEIGKNILALLEKSIPNWNDIIETDCFENYEDR